MACTVTCIVNGKVVPREELKNYTVEKPDCVALINNLIRRVNNLDEVSMSSNVVEKMNTI